jgi:hypothetical protein
MRGVLISNSLDKISEWNYGNAHIVVLGSFRSWEKHKHLVEVVMIVKSVDFGTTNQDEFPISVRKS